MRYVADVFKKLYSKAMSWSSVDAWVTDLGQTVVACRHSLKPVLGWFSWLMRVNVCGYPASVS